MVASYQWTHLCTKYSLFVLCVRPLCYGTGYIHFSPWPFEIQTSQWFWKDQKGCNFPTFISTCLLVKIPRIYPSRLILRWIEAFWDPNSSPRDFFGSIPAKVLWSFWKLYRYRNNSLDKKPIGFSRENRNKPFSTTTISLKRDFKETLLLNADKLYILLGST